MGLLGKEYAKDQERRLTVDLNDAVSVTIPPSLLEQSCFGSRRYYGYSGWDF